MLDVAKAAVRKLGCVGEGAVYVIDVNRADPSDPFTSCVRRNPSAAIIFMGISIATPPQVLARLREVLSGGVLKNENNLTANYRHSNVFVLCEGETKKANAVGFVRDDRSFYSIDGDTVCLLETIGADRNSVIMVSAPNEGQINDIYEQIFLPLLSKSAAKCGCNVCIELTETAMDEMMKRLRSVIAWSNMYNVVEDIVLAVIADGPDRETGQAAIDYDSGRFCTEERRSHHPDVETRE